MSKNIFFAGLILAASGYLSPPFALAAGLIYGFTFAHPYNLDARRLSKLLLQVSVVGLGFGMNLQQVMHAGRSGFLYTAASITFAMLLGWGLGRFLNVKKRVAFLILPARPSAEAAQSRLSLPSQGPAKRRLPSPWARCLC